MPMPAKKGGLGLMLSMSEPDDEGGGMGEKEMAVRDFFTAGKRGDWKGAAASFQEAYDLCAMHAGEGEEDEEYPELEEE